MDLIFDVDELFDACKTGDLEQVKYLVDEQGRDPKEDYNRAIQIASKEGYLELVKYLVGKGCDPTAEDDWAIRTASEEGHLELVKYLAEEQGCDPQAYNNYAIIAASGYGHLELAKYLTEEQGCNPYDRDNLAIYLAYVRGHPMVTKYLLELGCDHKVVKKYIKYEVLQDVKIRLLTFLNKRFNNKYLKMEILKRQFPGFTEWEIMSIQ